MNLIILAFSINNNSNGGTISSIVVIEIRVVAVFVVKFTSFYLNEVKFILFYSKKATS